MKVYTKSGDRGETSLLNGARVSKTDERIELLGAIDELNSHLGLVRAIAEQSAKEELGEIQRILMRMMAGIASEGSSNYAILEEQISKLENDIDRMEEAFPRPKEFVLYGECELSARLDVARAVARRAERQFFRVAKEYTVDERAQKFLNRLADYLYVYARYTDYEKTAERVETVCREVVTQVLAEMRIDSPV